MSEQAIINAIKSGVLADVQNLVSVPDTIDKGNRIDTKKYRPLFTPKIKAEVGKLSIRDPIYKHMQTEGRKIGEEMPMGNDPTYTFGTGGRKKTRKGKGKKSRKTRGRRRA